MKITVLNGSPKGKLSKTLHSLRFIEKKFTEVTLSEHHISQRIKRIASNETLFEEIMNDIVLSDAVIWSVPLYVLTVPSQYHRFIELIFEKKKESVFKDKYTAVITTSIHFFDNTAHTYMRAICEDLGMRYVDGFSPDQDDLMKKNQQMQLLNFAQNFMDTIQRQSVTTELFAPVYHDPIAYSAGIASGSIDASGKKILVLLDNRSNANLNAMIERYTSSFSTEVEVACIEDLNIKGGCIGCCKCGPDYKCSYEGTDEYIDFYNGKMKTANAIIFAGSIKGRYLSWQMKQFFDRSFFNTHTPTLKGKQLGFLIAGPLQQLENLKEILQAYLEWQKANLIGMVSDEYKTSEAMDAHIKNLAENTVSFLERSYQRPNTFLGMGGMKIFRDDIYGRLRFVFQADHKHYLENGYYDFPHDDKEANDFSDKMIAAMRNPNARKVIRDMIKAKMVEPHQKLVEKA